MSNGPGANVANKYRFGKRKYVNNEANIQEIISALRARGSHGGANRIEGASNKRAMAQKLATILAYNPSYGHSFANNQRNVGNIEAYYASMGMTNANKLKVFKSLFTTENINYPIISKNNRVLLTNNYRATPRNMEWFDMTGRSNPRWKAEVIANSANIMRRLGVVVTGGRNIHPNANKAIPLNAWPANLVDPISLKNRTNWHKNLSNKNEPENKKALAIRVNSVNKNNKVVKSTYFKPAAFNGWFGNGWKYLSPNSSNFIANRTHPETRQKVQRRHVRLVRFPSNK
jgi:hypothetical protein